jgi:hypothetical protein
MMIRLLGMVIMGLWSIGVFAAEIGFQMYVYDVDNQQFLNTTEPVSVQAGIIDTHQNLYFVTDNYRTIQDGFIDVAFTIDTASDADLGVFDMPDISVYVTVLGDTITMPLSSFSRSILALISNRAAQISDDQLMAIDYNQGIIQMGGSQSTASALVVSGSIRADQFIGNGQYLYHVSGAGLSDDHSLESNFSRTCAPNNQAANCRYGTDVVTVTNRGWVGVNTAAPQTVWDLRGSVLFRDGEPNVGRLSSPLPIDQSLLAWNHAVGAFTAGERYRQDDQFLQVRAAVSIGKDALVSGWYSGIWGGDTNTVSGQYASIIGGSRHLVLGDYAVGVGGDTHTIAKGYTVAIGGEYVAINATHAAAIAGMGSALEGSNIVAMGDANRVVGDDVTVLGNTNQVEGHDNLVMGDGMTITTNRIGMVNMEDKSPPAPQKDHQVVWWANNGVRVNTENYSADLTIGGTLYADTFEGDGSGLTQVSLVDKYWFRDGTIMVSETDGIALGITNRVLNAVNLTDGLRLGPADTSVESGPVPGTIQYENGDLIGYGTDGPHSLTIQDTATNRTGSNMIAIRDDTVQLSPANPEDFMIFDGNEWRHSPQQTWILGNGYTRYSRGVSWWSNPSEWGQFTVSHPVNNSIVWLSADGSNGVSLKMGNYYDMNQTIVMGLNTRPDTNGWTRMHPDRGGFQWLFDSSSGGYTINDYQNTPVWGMGPTGRLWVFEPYKPDDFAVNTPAWVSGLLVDANPDTSQLGWERFNDTPMLASDAQGNVTLQAATEAGRIQMRVLPKTYGSVADQVIWYMNADAQMVLGSETDNGFDHPMLVHPNGDVMLDAGYSMGVFSPDRLRQTGIQFNNDRMGFFSSNNEDEFAAIHVSAHGMGIRVVPDRMAVVADTNDSHVVLRQDTVTEHYVRVYGDDDRVWGLRSEEPGDFVIGRDQTARMQWSDGKWGMNRSIDPAVDMAIRGDMAISDGHLAMVLADNTTMKPVVELTSEGARLRPVSDALVFTVGDTHAVTLKNDRVIVGAVDDPNAQLIVENGVYASEGIYYKDEPITKKIIQTPTKSYGPQSANGYQRLGFDANTGFQVSESGPNTVTVSFAPHFSTIRIINPDDPSDPDTMQSIAAIGVDRLKFVGDNITITAEDTDAAGEIDALVFENTLQSGGVVEGDMIINGTLTVTGTNDDGDPFGVVGNIAAMTAIPFPWHHRDMIDDVVVNGEYVLTENVGIGRSDPEYPLDVAGTTSVMDMIAPDVDAGSLTPYSESMTIHAPNMTINVGDTTDAAITLNNLVFTPTQWGLNGFDSTYFASLYAPEGAALWRIQGNAQTEFWLGETASIQLTAGQWEFKSTNKAMRFQSQAGLLSVSNNYVVFHGTGFPNANLAVSGSVVVGEALAGTVTAPDNSLMVKHRLGIMTADPQSVTQVSGSVVVGDSAPYMGGLVGLKNDLVVQRQWIVGVLPTDYPTDDVWIDGDMSVLGGFYMNPQDNNHELSIFLNDTDEAVLGYSGSILNRDLTIQGHNYVKWSPHPDTRSLQIDNYGRLALGIDVPLTKVHIRSDKPVLRVESTEGNAAGIAFESKGASGRIGFANAVPGELLLSDGESPEDAGGDIAIKSDNTLDVGYNRVGNSAPQPTHDVRLDVDDTVNATNYYKKDAILTHMPVGSIIMWSGFTNELPEGWKLCTGVDDESLKTTAACNFSNLFVVGGGTNLNGETGNSNWSISTGDKYVHTHTDPMHGHTVNAAGHGHSGSSGSQMFLGDRGTTGASFDPGKISQCCDTYNEKDKIIANVYVYTNMYPVSHGHSVSVSPHSHTAIFNNSNHAHSMNSAAANHTNIAHSHERLSLEPEYYTLAFIYLEGITE